MSYTFALKNSQSLPTIAFFKILSLVLGFGLDQFCPWPREGLYLKSRSLVLSLNFFFSPWPQTLCPRLQICFKYRTRNVQLECDD